MDKIAEIRHLEAEADKTDTGISTYRWRAAQLIHEVVSDGTSRRGLADDIGKSHTHVNYMFKCWDLVGAKMFPSVPIEQLPAFQTVYMSTEVRGEPAAEAVQTGGGEARGYTGRGRQPKESDEPKTWIEIANEALAHLTDHPAFWPLFKDEERELLASFIPKIKKITEG